jgi:DNA-binding MarR family transcriptional regulator
VTTPPVLTRAIGQAERSMRPLLERKLASAELSFPEWTTLVFLDVDGALTVADIVDRQLRGQVVNDPDDAITALDRLRARDLVAAASGSSTGSPGNNAVVMTSNGRDVYGPLSIEVARTTEALFADLAEGDLETTHRVLTEVARRATTLT